MIKVWCDNTPECGKTNEGVCKNNSVLLPAEWVHATQNGVTQFFCSGECLVRVYMRKSVREGKTKLRVLETDEAAFNKLTTPDVGD